MTGPRIYPDNTAVSRTPRATPGLLDLLRSLLQKGQEGAEAVDQRLASGLPEGTLKGTFPEYIGGPGGVPKIVGKVGEGLKKVLGIGGKKPLVQAGMEGIGAWHGSPYRGIEKFDLSKVGTGRGQQNYGYGLYFAKDPIVAKSYRPDGALYRTRLEVDPDEMLDWEKPLASQPKVMGRLDPEAMGLRMSKLPSGYRAFVNAQNQPVGQMQRGGTANSFLRRWMDSMKKANSGETAYRALSNSTYIGTDLERLKNASSALKAAGVPGIKYFDNLWSRNYVMFDPERIKILEMLGLAGIGAFGAKKGNEAR